LLPDPVHDLAYGLGTAYGPEEERAAAEAIRGGSPGDGPSVAAFENAFARYLGIRHAIAVSSGTAALHLAVTALRLGPGDEVITTPLSWMSTANAAATAGAKVVFADVDPATFTLDPASAAAKITDRTRAIIPVHLYGQPADLDGILALARSRGIRVVEDCAHAPGAAYKGRKAGSFGDLAIFSFGYQKNMGTLGEGGMVVTDDDELAARVRSHRWICMERAPQGRRYWQLRFGEIGMNFRMTDVQAAVGLVQLGKLDRLNQRRREIAARYTEGLAGLPGLTLPFVSPVAEHVFHVYCVLVNPDSGWDKEELMWQLATSKRIRCWQHYMPIHLTEAYQALGHRRGECPVAEALFERYVSLPIHPRLTDEGVEYLIAAVSDLLLRKD